METQKSEAASLNRIVAGENNGTVITNFLSVHKRTSTSLRNGEGTGGKDPQKPANGNWKLPNSPVLAFISIPRSIFPPSPPLRLLCAEAAFHHLVLQGGKRARKEGLTNQQAKRRRKKKIREKRKTGEGKVNIQKVRKKEKSVLEPDIDFFRQSSPRDKSKQFRKSNEFGT